jgi:hypothetical protein
MAGTGSRVRVTARARSVSGERGRGATTNTTGRQKMFIYVAGTLAQLLPQPSP